jgi:tetratricopeptide (TPR) repeat protein
MLPENPRIKVESAVTFSESVVWDLQKKYFDKQGVNAWTGAVPFFVTSNPLISNSYANIVIRFIEDTITSGKYDKKQPFYIMEMGTGSGQFSFYCLKRLIELQKKLGLTDIKITYVMTDFTQANVDFWKQHPNFAPYLKAGQLDFAIYDLEATTEIKLQHSGNVLNTTTLTNPLIALGNYIFDTVSHDAFHVTDHNVQSALLHLEVDKNKATDGKPNALEGLHTYFSYEDIDTSKHYKNADWNAALAEHSTSIENGSFLFPIGSFKCFDSLRALSNNRLFIVSTDKGYTHPIEIEDRPDPAIVFHGSLSMSVNFHAIATYFKHIGGSAVHQTPREGIKTCVYSTEKLDNHVETNHAIERFVEDYSAADFFVLHRHLRESGDITLKLLLSHLHLCQYDPYTFSVFIDNISADIAAAPSVIKAGFICSIKKIAKNVYPMPGSDDHFFNLGLILHHMEQYSAAILMYLKAVKHIDTKFATHYNLGLCNHMEGHYKKSIKHLEQALTLSPNDSKTMEWIESGKAKLAG